MSNEGIGLLVRGRGIAGSGEIRWISLSLDRVTGADVGLAEDGASRLGWPSLRATGTGVTRGIGSSVDRRPPIEPRGGRLARPGGGTASTGARCGGSDEGGRAPTSLGSGSVSATRIARMVADDVPDGSTGSGPVERGGVASSPASSEPPRYRPESAVDDDDVVGIVEARVFVVDDDGVDVGGMALEDEDVELGVSELLRPTTDEYEVLDSVVGRARTETGAADVEGGTTGADDEADGRDGVEGCRAGGRDDCEGPRDDDAGTRTDCAGARVDGAGARVDGVADGGEDGATKGSSSSSARGSRLGRRSEDPNGRSTAIPAGLSFL